MCYFKSLIVLDGKELSIIKTGAWVAFYVRVFWEFKKEEKFTFDYVLSVSF